MKASNKQAVRECVTFQRSKVETIAAPGLLEILPMHTQVWIDISIDFIEGLPTSNGKITILVVVDRFSKYGLFH